MPQCVHVSISTGNCSCLHDVSLVCVRLVAVTGEAVTGVAVTGVPVQVKLDSSQPYDPIELAIGLPPFEQVSQPTPSPLLTPPCCQPTADPSSLLARSHCCLTALLITLPALSRVLVHTVDAVVDLQPVGFCVLCAD